MNRLTSGQMIWKGIIALLAIIGAMAVLKAFDLL
jgi:hypothetical protein